MAFPRFHQIYDLEKNPAKKSAVDGTNLARNITVTLRGVQTPECHFKEDLHPNLSIHSVISGVMLRAISQHIDPNRNPIAAEEVLVFDYKTRKLIGPASIHIPDTTPMKQLNAMACNKQTLLEHGVGYFFAWNYFLENDDWNPGNFLARYYNHKIQGLVEVDYEMFAYSLVHPYKDRSIRNKILNPETRFKLSIQDIENLPYLSDAFTHRPTHQPANGSGVEIAGVRFDPKGNIYPNMDEFRKLKGDAEFRKQVDTAWLKILLTDPDVLKNRIDHYYIGNDWLTADQKQLVANRITHFQKKRKELYNLLVLNESYDKFREFIFNHPQQIVGVLEGFDKDIEKADFSEKGKAIAEFNKDYINKSFLRIWRHCCGWEARSILLKIKNTLPDQATEKADLARSLTEAQMAKSQTVRRFTEHKNMVDSIDITELLEESFLEYKATEQAETVINNKISILGTAFRELKKLTHTYLNSESLKAHHTFVEGCQAILKKLNDDYILNESMVISANDKPLIEKFEAFIQKIRLPAEILQHLTPPATINNELSASGFFKRQNQNNVLQMPAQQDAKHEQKSPAPSPRFAMNELKQALARWLKAPKHEHEQHKQRQALADTVLNVYDSKYASVFESAPAAFAGWFSMVTTLYKTHSKENLTNLIDNKKQYPTALDLFSVITGEEIKGDWKTTSFNTYLLSTICENMLNTYTTHNEPEFCLFPNLRKKGLLIHLEKMSPAERKALRDDVVKLASQPLEDTMRPVAQMKLSHGK